VHENHCFIGTGWSEFEQGRTYAVNDDRFFAHSLATDLLALHLGTRAEGALASIPAYRFTFTRITRKAKLIIATLA
jgi:hypothetical protein